MNTAPDINGTKLKKKNLQERNSTCSAHYKREKKSSGGVTETSMYLFVSTLLTLFFLPLSLSKALGKQHPVRL